MKSWLSLVVLTFWLAGCDRLPSSSTPSSATTPESRATNSTTVAPTISVSGRPPAPAESNAEQYQQALTLENDGKLAEARALLQPLGDGGDASDKVLDLLGAIDMKILFTAASAPEKVDYTIAAGDSLGKLAQKFGTTIDLIKKSNNLTRDVIRIGDRLRIYQGHFAVTVSKATNELRLTDNGRFFKRYHVGTGEYSKTPVGDFKITTRLANPPWWRADGKTIPFGDPENILGTHWLGLNVPGYGIHGTWDTNSIGKQATAGCIRLLNDDVAELYTILPVGSPVGIHD
ncbi:MAG TPA: L,D-transpeptidase family protein [Verrucomicrobiae bacterium]|nr:L,D-transpeptidase family protein [Verrucomicrobiae bacterium]